MRHASQTPVLSTFPASRSPGNPAPMCPRTRKNSGSGGDSCSRVSQSQVRTISELILATNSRFTPPTPQQLTKTSDSGGWPLTHVFLARGLPNRLALLGGGGLSYGCLPTDEDTSDLHKIMVPVCFVFCLQRERERESFSHNYYLVCGGLGRKMKTVVIIFERSRIFIGVSWHRIVFTTS